MATVDDILKGPLPALNVQSPTNLPPVPKDTTTLAQEERARESEFTTKEVLMGSMRQNFVAAPIVAAVSEGAQAPDPSYNVLDDSNWKQATEGLLPDEFKHATRATSRAHALMIRNRLIQNRNDSEAAQRMGIAGNLLVGALDPAGWATGSSGAKLAASVFGVASRGARLGRVGTATTTTAAMDVAMEKLRQDANFENSPEALTAQALLGLTLGGAFNHLETRAALKLANTAQGELAHAPDAPKVHEEPAKAPEVAPVDPDQHLAETMRSLTESGRAGTPKAYTPTTREVARAMRQKEARKVAEQKRAEMVHAAQDMSIPAEDVKGLDELLKEAAPEAPKVEPSRPLEPLPAQAAAQVVPAIPEPRGPIPDAPKVHDDVNLDDHIGSSVSWDNGEEFLDGTIIGHTKTGKLIVDPVGGGQHAYVSRHSLPYDHPAYLAKKVEGMERPDVFSRPALDANPKSPFRFGLSHDEVKHAVHKALSTFNADAVHPRVVVVHSKELPFRVGSEKGFMDKGVIHLIHDNITSSFDAARTFYHELFHWGLRRLLHEEEYIDVMKELYNNSDLIRKHAEEHLTARRDDWTEKGYSHEKQMALATEEAAAEVKDLISEGSKLLKLSTRERLVASLADTARALGLEPIARWLESRTYKDALNFVDDTVNKALKGINGPTLQTNVDTLFRSGTAPDASVVSMQKARLDIYKSMAVSTNPVVKAFAQMAVKDGIGDANFKVAQQATVSELRSRMVRTVGGNFHNAYKQAYREALLAGKPKRMERGAFEDAFGEAVAKLARGNNQALDGLPPGVQAAVRKAAGAFSEAYEKMAGEVLHSGVKNGEAVLNMGSNYVTRKWSFDKLKGLMREYGEDAVYDIVAAAIRTPGIQDPKAKAKTFLSAVLSLEYKGKGPDVLLQAQDMGSLRHELAKAGMDPAAIDDVVDVMFTKRGDLDKGSAANLKSRFDLDENLPVTMPDGKELTVSDLLENDPRLLLDSYLNTMAGHVAWAKRGIKSEEDFHALVRQADDHHGNNILASGSERYMDERQMMHDIYLHLTGRRMSNQPFNTADRVMGVMRAATRTLKLGQLGISSMFEAANGVALQGIKASAKHLPTFEHIRLAALRGEVPTDAISTFIHNQLGLGLEGAASYARQAEIGDMTYGRGLTKLENFTNQSSHAVDVLSGNRFWTAELRRQTAAAAIQKYSDFSVNPTTLTEAARKRMVHQGVPPDAIDTMLEDLSNYTVRDSSGRIDTVRYEDWANTHNDSYNHFLTAVERDARESIQDPDIGETMMAQHGPIGKFFFELRNFMLVSHVKQFLKGMAHRDTTTAMQWFLTAMAGSVSYIAQTSMNYAHDQAALEKKLTLENIAKATAQRMGVTGVSTLLFDTAYGIATGGGSLLAGGSTNTGNRNLFVPPSLSLAMDMMQAPTTLNKVLNPWAHMGATKQDVSSALGTVVPNLYGLRNVSDMIASTFPKHVPQPQ